MYKRIKNSEKEEENEGEDHPWLPALDLELLPLIHIDLISANYLEREM